LLLVKSNSKNVSKLPFYLREIKVEFRGKRFLPPRGDNAGESSIERVTGKVTISDRQSQFTAARAAYWDRFAANAKRWRYGRRYYQERLGEIYRSLVPPNSRVLELGCGQGDLLARLRPARGVGVDLSSAMVALAREAHPNLTFIRADAHDLDLSEKFDAIVCSDLVNDVWDVQQVVRTAALHSHPGTRLIINTYSRVWELPRRLSEMAGITQPLLEQNWLTVEDLAAMLCLENFETVRSFQEILWPFRIPIVSTFLNRYLVKLPLINLCGLTNVIVARPAPQLSAREPVVSVVVPARNEEGNIKNIFDHVPRMGAGTELIFVEGHSTDKTYAAIEAEIASRPGCRAQLFRQMGKGKGDAVRLGFTKATGDLLMVLDADLTVRPEELVRFYEAWRSGKGEFVNGVRLVYPMEKGSMRFFNLLGNKFFCVAFSWLLGQHIKDTLCGTKVIGRGHYEVIAANRSYFGSLDPFGDFDLLFGAARFNLKIIDLPVRYRERTYGTTNIARWRHGALLLRMLLLALRRVKFI
jgi:SAM-dependent methyltransferase